MLRASRAEPLTILHREQPLHLVVRRPSGDMSPPIREALGVEVAPPAHLRLQPRGGSAAPAHEGSDLLVRVGAHLQTKTPTCAAGGDRARWRL